MANVHALKPADCAFDGEAANSYTLPARYYLDPEIFAAEQQAIFYRAWHYAGHRSRLSAPGSFLTTRIHAQNIFVIRGADDEIRAFYNVCQHRGHELVAGTGVVKSAIVCPYHGWAYQTSGELKHARNTGGLPCPA